MLDTVLLHQPQHSLDKQQGCGGNAEKDFSPLASQHRQHHHCHSQEQELEQQAGNPLRQQQHHLTQEYLKHRLCASGSAALELAPQHLHQGHLMGGSSEPQQEPELDIWSTTEYVHRKAASTPNGSTLQYTYPPATLSYASASADLGATGHSSAGVQSPVTSEPTAASALPGSQDSQTVQAQSSRARPPLQQADPCLPQPALCQEQQQTQLHQRRNIAAPEVLQVPVDSTADVVVAQRAPSKASTGPHAERRARQSIATPGADVDQCCRMRYAPAETQRPNTDSPLASPDGQPEGPAVIPTLDGDQGGTQAASPGSTTTPTARLRRRGRVNDVGLVNRFVGLPQWRWAVWDIVSCSLFSCPLLLWRCSNYVLRKQLSREARLQVKQAQARTGAGPGVVLVEHVGPEDVALVEWLRSLGHKAELAPEMSVDPNDELPWAGEA